LLLITYSPKKKVIDVVVLLLYSAICHELLEYNMALLIPSMLINGTNFHFDSRACKEGRTPFSQWLEKKETEAAPKMDHQSKRCIVYRTLVEEACTLKSTKDHWIGSTLTELSFPLYMQLCKIVMNVITLRSILLIISISKED